MDDREIYLSSNTPRSRYEAILSIDDTRAPPRIDEEILALRHVVDVDFLLLVHPRQYVRGRQQLQRVPQTDLDPVLGHLFERRLRDGQALRPRPDADNVLDLVRGVRVGGDDEDAGEEVGRDAVGGDDVLGAPDGAFAAVRGEDDDGGDGGFEGAVEVGEAFDVEHVHLG